MQQLSPHPERFIVNPENPGERVKDPTLYLEDMSEGVIDEIANDILREWFIECRFDSQSLEKPIGLERARLLKEKVEDYRVTNTKYFLKKEDFDSSFFKICLKILRDFRSHKKLLSEYISNIKLCAIFRKISPDLGVLKDGFIGHEDEALKLMVLVDLYFSGYLKISNEDFRKEVDKLGLTKSQISSIFAVFGRLPIADISKTIYLESRSFSAEERGNLLPMRYIPHSSLENIYSPQTSELQINRTSQDISLRKITNIVFSSATSQVEDTFSVEDTEDAGSPSQISRYIFPVGFLAGIKLNKDLFSSTNTDRKSQLLDSFSRFFLDIQGQSTVMLKLYSAISGDKSEYVIDLDKAKRAIFYEFGKFVFSIFDEKSNLVKTRNLVDKDGVVESIVESMSKLYDPYEPVTRLGRSFKRRQNRELAKDLEHKMDAFRDEESADLFKVDDTNTGEVARRNLNLLNMLRDPKLSSEQKFKLLIFCFIYNVLTANNDTDFLNKLTSTNRRTDLSRLGLEDDFILDLEKESPYFGMSDIQKLLYRYVGDDSHVHYLVVNRDVKFQDVLTDLNSGIAGGNVFSLDSYGTEISKIVIRDFLKGFPSKLGEDFVKAYSSAKNNKERAEMILYAFKSSYFILDIRDL